MDTQILAAAGMLLVTIALVAGIWKYLTSNSERRMRSMLVAEGLDPAIVNSGDMPTIMKDVQSRCLHCAVEGVCERWLAGEEAGAATFCPNHRVFEILRKYLPA